MIHMWELKPKIAVKSFLSTVTYYTPIGQIIEIGQCSDKNCTFTQNISN